jgi:HPt (histidine-containing phosphotransfer) domain-containing protein
MNGTVIDRATYDELKATAGGDFVVELVNTFLADAPTLLDGLERSLAVGDEGAFRRAAHSLKSNSNTFGAFSLGAMARELELAGVDAVKRSNDAPLEALSREYARVAAALAELRDA